MARGWESKSVESQITDRSQRPAGRPGPQGPEPKQTREDRERERRLNSLMLSRTRILGEIETCCHQRFREQLQRELAFLDQELAKLTIT